MQLIEENIGKKLHDTGCGNFLDISKAQATKVKNR